MSYTVGILAVQGCIAPHEEKLHELGVTSKRVLDANDLNLVDGLILPGGESTTMLKLLDSRDMWNSLKKFCASKPSWGVCAGAILLATTVQNPRQKSLGAIEICAQRNAYGSQRESFKGSVCLVPSMYKLTADFIRAPALEALSERAETLAIWEGNAVAFRQNLCMVTAFHTELGNDSFMHQLFLQTIEESTNVRRPCPNREQLYSA
jgi:5'-phosphate synthase pdxT subunit